MKISNEHISHLFLERDGRWIFDMTIQTSTFIVFIPMIYFFDPANLQILDYLGRRLLVRELLPLMNGVPGV